MVTWAEAHTLYTDAMLLYRKEWTWICEKPWVKLPMQTREQVYYHRAALASAYPQFELESLSY